MPSIYDRVREEAGLSTLLDAVGRAGLGELLDEYGPNTLFAPGDVAFDRLSIACRHKMLNDHDFVRRLVDNHVVAGKFTLDDLHEHYALRSNACENLPVRDVDGLRIRGARIVRSLECDNGIVHVLDGVLVPYEREERLTA